MTGATRGTYALDAPVGRRRRPDPPVVVTVVLSSGEEVALDESALARAMGQVARLLAHW
jgi:hypothetical protein